MSGSSARYQRSFPGMIGALLVTLLAIGAFVGFRAVVRDDAAVTPDRVDYGDSVRYAAEQGIRVAHPVELPAGWFARDVAFAGGASPVWSVDFLTETGRYVGVRQESTTEEVLVERLVGEDASRGAPVRLPGAVVTTWHTYTDEGGDYALVAELSDVPGFEQPPLLAVVGSAEEQAIREFATSLTLDRPQDRSR